MKMILVLPGEFVTSSYSKDKLRQRRNTYIAFPSAVDDLCFKQNKSPDKVRSSKWTNPSSFLPLTLKASCVKNTPGLGLVSVEFNHLHFVI